MLPADEPVILPGNRSYRYGDGLFETMKVLNGHVLLEPHHMERLFAGLKQLQFAIPSLFTPSRIREEVIHLVRKNGCEELARVRLSVSRGEGGLYDEDNTLHYLIECWPLQGTANTLNQNGLDLGVYTEAIKSADAFSGLKSANFLAYRMAALYAKAGKLNDCLVLNQHGRIADSTIANLFVFREGRIITPPLTEGCVNGVMRKYLREQSGKAGFVVAEQPLTIAELKQSEEIFLTNAINGIRWVKQFEGQSYSCIKTTEIYRQFIQPLYA